MYSAKKCVIDVDYIVHDPRMNKRISIAFLCFVVVSVFLRLHFRGFDSACLLDSVCMMHVYVCVCI